MPRTRCVVTTALGAALLSTSALAQVITTPAASQEQASLASGAPFPAIPPMPFVTAEIQDATSGTPRIDLIRAGQYVTTFTTFADQSGCQLRGDGTDASNEGDIEAAMTGCGPFDRVRSFTLLQPGDVLNVYPARYTGALQQPWIGGTYDNASNYDMGIVTTPTDIHVHGIVQNGVRPVIACDGGSSGNNTDGQALVYADLTLRLVVDNINISGVGGGCNGTAGLYINAAMSPTFNYMHVHDFAPINGVFGTGNASGVLSMTGIEVDHVGSGNGPQHGFYINASLTDPNYTFRLRCSWVHDVDYGHLVKSRAQNTALDGDYLQGVAAPPNGGQGEAFATDISNGGGFLGRNLIIDKGNSGPNSNGIGIAYEFEGPAPSSDAPRKNHFGLTHSLIRADALTYDGSHPLIPLLFYYPALTPGDADFPAHFPVFTSGNVFAGYQPLSGAEAYRGSAGVVAATSEVGADGRTTGDAHVLAGPVGFGATYQHPAMCGPRRTSAMAGAFD